MMKLTRRELLTAGLPALAATVLPPNTALAAAMPPAVSPLATGKAWPARRKQIERAWLDLLGDFPTEIPPLKPSMKQASHAGGITRYHVSFQAEPDDRVTAWLLVPDSAKRKRAPAIINIHSTTWGAGKDSTAGLAGRRPQDPPTAPEIGRASGLELARHGYVTLCIDLLTDGERIKPGERVMDTRGFYLKHPEWSIVGKNIWDVMRSVDFLQTLDFVESKQIGVIGWSLGGHSALFAGAFDPRIAATISNGGVLDWHRKVDAWSRKPDDWKPWVQGDPERSNPELERRFGFKTNSGPYIYIKKFRPYIEDQAKRIPTDFDELMMLVAPRPLLIISSEWEFYSHKIIPKCLEAAKVYAGWRDVEGLPSVMAARQQRIGYDQTLAYYEFNNKLTPDRIAAQISELGAGDAFSWFSFPGGHAYPPVARQMTFAWYDRWLGHRAG